MKRVFILLMATAVALPFAYASARGSSGAVKKTSICHRTGKASPAYVKISVSATQLKTHAKHAADIIPAPRGACPRTILTTTSGGTGLSATLVGESENPAGDPVATGTATVRLRLNQGQACFTLDAKNLPTAAVAAHIHTGAAGAVGGIVVPLTTPNASGASGGCVAAARAVVKRILAAPAGFYVNIHTSGFPGGAVRGQLDGSGSAGWVAAVSMNGTVERPAGDPDGTGTAVIRIRDDNQVCYRFTVQNIVLPATGAHIHRGPSTGTGPIVVPFTAPDANGASTGCTAADPALVAEIKGTPANFYANVHSRDFPAGAVRAQLG
jgi:hypothetical protein